MKHFIIGCCLTLFGSGLCAQNRALEFDGVDDRIDLYLPPISGDWTVSCWVKGNDALWREKETLLSNGWVHVPQWQQEQLTLQNGYVVMGDQLRSKAPLDAQWHHLAAVHSGTKNLLYVDGILQGSVEGGGDICPSFIGSSERTNFFSGKIDEVQVWNAAFSENEIVQQMGHKITSHSPHYKKLVACYGFDDGNLDATDFTGRYNGDIKHYYDSKGDLEDPIYTLANNPKMHGGYTDKDCVAKQVYGKENFSFTPSHRDKNTLKLLEWNIWHGGRESGETLGKQRVVDIVKKTDADVILMIETYGSAPFIAEKTGYKYYTLDVNDNLCIFSRYPIVEKYKSNYNGFKSIGAKVQMPNGKEVVVWDTWLTYEDPDCSLRILSDENCSEYDFIDADTRTGLKDIKGIVSKDVDHYNADTSIPTILAGDFNTSTHLDWGEGAAFKKAHYGRTLDLPIGHFMIENHFTDSYREMHPKKLTDATKTWSALYQYCKGWRIDFVFYRGEGIHALDSRIINQHPDVHQMFPSDHAAVLTTYEVR